jgi:hypothetical protein
LGFQFGASRQHLGPIGEGAHKPAYKSGFFSSNHQFWSAVVREQMLWAIRIIYRSLATSIAIRHDITAVAKPSGTSLSDKPFPGPYPFPTSQH